VQIKGSLGLPFFLAPRWEVQESSPLLIPRRTMNAPTPALVSQRAVQRIPRLALLLFCGAYVLPGVFGRDPWKNADITAFGYMMSLVRGTSSWWQPSLGGVPGDGGVLPYWLGAVFIKLGTPWLDPALAARIPFALLLVLVLALMWYATYHLARTQDAQPVPFAFGGEAQPADYARAIADGSLLALISALGLLQLGHETTPELVQLAATALFIYGLAAAPTQRWPARLALLAAPMILAASAAPTTAVWLVGAGLLVNLRSRFEPARRTSLWLLLGLAGAVGLSFALGTWGWRVGTPQGAAGLPKLIAWFAWPVWPLAAWTLWCWRGHITHRHVSVPLLCSVVAIGSSLAMGSSDRALMLALPGLAVLAAFALPTLKRSMGGLIDWFSVFFFSGWALAFWVVYLSMQLGVPAKPAINVSRLLPGFTPSFNAWALFAAVLGSCAWIWLVSWRTGRNRHPIWKSLVLPAGGVALNWLLAMTLLLPPLDFAFTYKPLTQRIARHVPRGECIDASRLHRPQVAALEVAGRWRIDARVAPGEGCAWRLVNLPFRQAVPTMDGWQLVARERRPGDRGETIVIYKRSGRYQGSL